MRRHDPGEGHEHEHSGTREGCRHFNRAKQWGGKPRRIGRAPDIQREQHKHGNQIEHPFHDDGRERRRGAQALLPGEQVRAQHVARASRQDRQRCGTDDRRPERRPEPRPPYRPQQVLPSIGADHVRQNHHHEAHDEQVETRPAHLHPHVCQVGVVQKPRKKGNRQNGHQYRTYSHPGPFEAHEPHEPLE